MECDTGAVRNVASCLKIQVEEVKQTNAGVSQKQPNTMSNIVLEVSDSVSPMMIVKPNVSENESDLKEKVARLEAQLLQANEQHQRDVKKKQDKISDLLKYITRIVVENTKIKNEITNLKHKKAVLEFDCSTQTNLTGHAVKTIYDINQISTNYEVKMKEQHKKENEKHKEAHNKIRYLCKEMRTMQTEITNLHQKQFQLRDTILAGKQEMYEKDLECRQIEKNLHAMDLHCKQQKWKINDLQDDYHYLKRCIGYYKNIVENYRSWYYYEEQAYQHYYHNNNIKYQSPHENKYQSYYQTYRRGDRSNCTQSMGRGNAIVPGGMKKRVVALQTIIETEPESRSAHTQTNKSKNDVILLQSSVEHNNKTKQDTVTVLNQQPVETDRTQLNYILNETESHKINPMQGDSVMCKPLPARINELRQAAMLGGSPTVSLQTTNFQQHLHSNPSSAHAICPTPDEKIKEIQRNSDSNSSNLPASDHYTIECTNCSDEGSVNESSSQYSGTTETESSSSCTSSSRSTLLDESVPEDEGEEIITTGGQIRSEGGLCFVQNETSQNNSHSTQPYAPMHDDGFVMIDLFPTVHEESRFEDWQNSSKSNSIVNVITNSSQDAISSNFRQDGEIC